MSLDREMCEQFAQMPEHEPKILTQQTTKFCLTQTSPCAPSIDFETYIGELTDSSFDNCMRQENIQNIRTASDRLLDDCLEGGFDKTLGFQDTTLYKAKAIELKGDNELESVISHNQLLTPEMNRELCAMLEKEAGLIGLLMEAPESFGLTVAREIVYVIYHILNAKLESFRQLLQLKESVIPKMNCFQDFDEEAQLTTSCPVYEDVSIEETIAFADKDIEACAHEMYFSDIRVLNFREVTCGIKKEVSLMDKFCLFVRQVSKSVFLSIIGATEPTRGLMGVDLSREISMAELSECGLSLQKSMSRPFLSYDDEESYDFISKKVKFQ